MNTEDLMKAIEQVAAQADNKQDRIEKEAYINSVIQHLIMYARSSLMMETTYFPSMRDWAIAHEQHFALQIGEVARILLHKEMFGE